MSLNDLMALLVAELADGDIPTPLTQRFTLANIWADLARLAGEPVPPEVAALLDGRGVTLARAGRAAIASPTPRQGGPCHDDE
jgi:hypothetical protein